MLLAVLLIALASLAGWQRVMDDTFELINEEQGYLNAFHQAESALSWGMSQSWLGNTGQCQSPAGNEFKVCLLKHNGQWLLRGHVANEALAETLFHYRLVLLHPVAATSVKLPGCWLMALPGGWLDYYPELAQCRVAPCRRQKNVEGHYV